MKIVFSALFLLVLVSCKEGPEIEPETVSEMEEILEVSDPGLSVDDLARALGVRWCEIKLPGDASDQWSVGAIIEYGDGGKAQRTGSIRPIAGGSKIKLVVYEEGEALNSSILAGSATSFGKFPTHPFKASMMLQGGQLEADQFLMKGNADPYASLDDSTTLKTGEFGLRLMIEPVQSEEGNKDSP